MQQSVARTNILLAVHLRGRMMLAVLPPTLLSAVVSSRGCDMHQLLEPLRGEHPCQLQKHKTSRRCNALSYFTGSTRDKLCSELLCWQICYDLDCFLCLAFSRWPYSLDSSVIFMVCCFEALTWGFIPQPMIYQRP